jgi:hypothetical protein
MADYPSAYTVFNFVDDCDSFDVEAELEELRNRVEDLEITSQDVYV